MEKWSLSWSSFYIYIFTDKTIEFILQNKQFPARDTPFPLTKYTTLFYYGIIKETSENNINCWVTNASVKLTSYIW